MLFLSVEWMNGPSDLAKEMDLIMTMNGIVDVHIIFLFHTQNDAPAYIPICSVMRLNDRTNYKHKIFPNN